MRVYYADRTVDDTAQFTKTYFERVLCSDSSLAQTHPPRTHSVLSLVYDPSIVDGRSDTVGPSSGALEIGIFGWEKEPRCLHLVVGRHETRRRRAPPPRPDDPLPRIRSASEVWASSDDEDARVLKRGNNRLTPDKTARTPGRRGEKRRSLPAPEKAVSATQRTCAWKKVADVRPLLPNAEHFNEQIEADNRALIKRLARYQLLGRGVDKDDRDYGQLFQVVYAGTCLVFRAVLGNTILDHPLTAAVISAHLDMYLEPLVLCTRV